jgi:hypothetical protein
VGLITHLGVAISTASITITGVVCGKGSQMAERLGNVLYWAANGVAIPLLLLGSFLVFVHYNRRTTAIYGPEVIAVYRTDIGSPEFAVGLCVAGFAVGLFGRACRYVLAGR